MVTVQLLYSRSRETRYVRVELAKSNGQSPKGEKTSAASRYYMICPRSRSVRPIKRGHVYGSHPSCHETTLLPQNLSWVIQPTRSPKNLHECCICQSQYKKPTQDMFESTSWKMWRRQHQHKCFILHGFFLNQSVGSMLMSFVSSAYRFEFLHPCINPY